MIEFAIRVFVAAFLIFACTTMICGSVALIKITKELLEEE